MPVSPTSNEATFYRTALLLGLVRGDVVHAWAERAIERESNPHAAFIEIVGAPVDDLSEMRHALWPLVIDPPPLDVLRAVLGLALSQLADGRRNLDDTITVLRQLRSMVKLPKELYDALNAALVAHAADPETHNIAKWLNQFEGRSI